ncbi:MAG: FAD-binding oxidoreductase, partial [Gammaproteobacteria bacterium]
DSLNHLENTGVYTGMPFLGSPLLGSNLAPGEQLRARIEPEVQALLATPGGPKPEDLERYCAKTGVGLWACKLQFYGPEKVIRAQWEYSKETLSAISGARFDDTEFYRLPLTPEQVEKVHKVSFGIPNLSMFFIGARSETNPTPGEGHIWFSPIIPRTGEAVFEAQRVFTQAARELGLPISPLAVASTYWQRAFIFIFGFPITHDIETNRKNR